ncbi:cyclin-domain-containing protein [Mycena floridula]|nr:cyclin-domain-containing protein [Mycena floridula]
MTYTFYTPPPLTTWRKQPLISPPMTTHIHSRKLPPIAHLDRRPSAEPLTPPDEPPHLPPILTEEPSRQALFHDANLNVPVDWIDFARTKSARFIAEKTCEMICYLWFQSSTRPNHALQLVTKPTFVDFVQKLLETTQVSQSVIVLSLHYIYRLKERNRWTPAQDGSEFRIAVAGLMMANKFLDDNTYTNKTWSEVSGITLVEINRMEREFLSGVDFNLFVSKSTYESWLNLLKGLVFAKEKDARRYGRKARKPPHLVTPVKARHKAHLPRARSTSPQRTLVLPAPDSYERPGCKRTATDAFSPQLFPSKRPVSMVLQIPETIVHSSSSSSYSPLEAGLQSMTIDSPVERLNALSSPEGPWRSTGPTEPWRGAETLATAYPFNERQRMVQAEIPKNLYFYTLASRSPKPSPEQTRHPKARLRYHSSEQQYHPSEQQQQPIPYYQPPSYYQGVQSARTSPSRAPVQWKESVPIVSLPSFQDAIWTRCPEADRLPPIHCPQPQRPACHISAPEYPSDLHPWYSPNPMKTAAPCYAPYAKASPPYAPFANAGPPGVYSYEPFQQEQAYQWDRRQSRW